MLSNIALDIMTCLTGEISLKNYFGIIRGIYCFFTDHRLALCFDSLVNCDLSIAKLHPECLYTRAIYRSLAKVTSTSFEILCCEDILKLFKCGLFKTNMLGHADQLGQEASF